MFRCDICGGGNAVHDAACVLARSGYGDIEPARPSLTQERVREALGTLGALASEPTAPTGVGHPSAAEPTAPTGVERPAAAEEGVAPTTGPHAPEAAASVPAEQPPIALPRSTKRALEPRSVPLAAEIVGLPPRRFVRKRHRR